MTRILGIDYGTKRIGVAISDETQTIAKSLCVIKHTNFEIDSEKIKKLVLENDVKGIVIGIAKKSDGTLGKIAKEAISLKESIKAKIDIKIEVYDEAMTTKDAESLMRELGVSRKKKKENVDKIAAKIMLQEYLSKINN